MKRLLSIILFLSVVASMHAMTEIITVQDTILEQSKDSLQIYFRQGKTLWAPEYMDNERRLREFVDRFRELRRSQVMSKISKIYIVSGASPEGSYALNRRLSDGRAERIRNVLKQYISLPDSVIVTDSRGVNWKDLYTKVKASNMQYRDEILDIIQNTPELDPSRGYNYELRKKTLEKLHGGAPYKYMYKEMFPELRIFYLQIGIDWERYEQAQREVAKEMGLLEKEESPELVIYDTIRVPWPEPLQIELPKQPKPWYMAVKTNMLYDALLTPNIGVEFYLGKNYTVSADWMYAWWRKHSIAWWHRTYGGDLEIRRYFGRVADEKPLQGWHVGLYGGIVTYDFDWGGRGYLGDRWSYGGGLSIGYSMPWKRRLNLDFTLGLGYLGGEYKEYLPIDDCYVWQCTKQRNYIGPTKIEVSLVWLIGRGNYNEGK